MDEASVAKYELSQTHTKLGEKNPFKITDNQVHRRFFPTCNSGSKSKVLTCPLLSTSSFGVFVLQGRRGHQFST